MSINTEYASFNLLPMQRRSCLVAATLFICTITCVQLVYAEQRQIKRALLIVDVQNSFLDDGQLPVPRGGDVVPVINKIRQEHGKEFSLVVLSQDWHCPEHVSFASQHSGRKPFETIELHYTADKKLCNDDLINSQYGIPCAPGDIKYSINQTLWPDHCIFDTKGAEFVPTLIREPTDIVIQKGWRCHVDSYSTFFDNGGFEETPLLELFKKHEIEEVYFTGLALDYCVFWSSKDAKAAGFDTFVIEDATRGIGAVTIEHAKTVMMDVGIRVVKSSELGFVFDEKLSSFSNWVIASVIAIIVSIIANRVILYLQHGSKSSQN